MSDHRARYKNSGLDNKELRRRREENSVQLRKQKRDEVLIKRRNLQAAEDLSDGAEFEDDNNYSHLDGTDPGHEITQEMVNGVLQNIDTELLIENAQKIRKILSKEPQPPFDDVIKTGLVPRFVELLDRHDDTTIQFEVAWILTNICSGTTEQTRVVVQHQAVPKLVALMGSPDMKVCEQAVWAIGNIIGDGPEFRDMAISLGFIPALLSLIRPDIDIGFLRNETWVLVNLCRIKEPPTSIEVIKQLLPALDYLIQSSDLPILIDTTWAISYITESGQEYSQLIIDFGLVHRITPLLSNSEIKIQTAAIRALGSIVTGSDEQTQSVVDAKPLPHLCRILKEGNPRIVREALWFISNITAGSSDQIQDVIDSNIMPSIINRLDNGEVPEKKEALWTVMNFCLSGCQKQLWHLYNHNVIPPLCKALKFDDPTNQKNAIESLKCILDACAPYFPDWREQIEESDGLRLIEELQYSEDKSISMIANSIADTYLKEEE